MGVETAGWMEQESGRTEDNRESGEGEEENVHNVGLADRVVLRCMHKVFPDWPTAPFNQTLNFRLTNVAN